MIFIFLSKVNSLIGISVVKGFWFWLLDNGWCFLVLEGELDKFGDFSIECFNIIVFIL